MANALDLASTPCLTDEEVVTFAAGRMEGSRLSVAHQHLDDCVLCQLLLSEAAHSLATATTLPSFVQQGGAWNTTFQAGAVVGQRYVIRRFIARGGMGEVYEAFDRDLQERVALKTVTSTACDNPSAVRRLKGEVQLARRVSHPNVCRIYDFGTHVMPDSAVQISFLTMEFVDGETLGDRLRSTGPLSISEARRLGRQLLLGLGAAHDAGVLHRDFKSDNVMLKEVSGQPCPLILDFGLARPFDDYRQRTGSLSNAGLVGTIRYLAPEQLQGKPHSTSSDIYSLGMVWFEMLTGELPFEDSPSPAVAALERMQKPAPSPSSRNPAVPSDLDGIVAGCLRRSPKHRFRTTAQAIAALDELERRSQPFWGRGKRWLIGASACSLAAAGLGAVGAQPPPPAHAFVATPNAILPASEPERSEKPAVDLPPPAPTTRQAAHRPPDKGSAPPVPARQSSPSQPSDGGLAKLPPAPSSSAQVHAPRTLDWENPFDAGPPSEPNAKSR
ncbi:MAG: protein kinase [Myxococcales bacterium]